MKKPLTVITGPTASGKTAMSIELAIKKGGEIVNADSMQVYKHMDIGTAKPPAHERKGITHHLIDIVEPTERFSVAQYTAAAHNCINDIHNRGKLPILVGGTGLYIDSVVKNIKYAKGGVDENYRLKLRNLEKQKGAGYLHNKLKKIDEAAAKTIHPIDIKRTIRALEVYQLTGKTITEQKRQSQLEGPLYDTQIFCIDIDRNELYNRINARVESMFANGLVNEALKLFKMGIDERFTSMQGIGYKETLHYIKGIATLEETKNIIARNTRRYAKRQLTWFRKNEKIIWIRGQVEW
ncbi:MAG: tRNA (adenosine(37)-N6)-dimethylallyltransferase MiaA [Firmicutes bacterium]|nr:tRNA (adenosine(37)-N6)-dimethylallyltransferase MiaA [Bacillota bacterium]